MRHVYGTGQFLAGLLFRGLELGRFTDVAGELALISAVNTAQTTVSNDQSAVVADQAKLATDQATEVTDTATLSTAQAALATRCEQGAFVILTTDVPPIVTLYQTSTSAPGYTATVVPVGS
jgi:hypothetical protein